MHTITSTAAILDRLNSYTGDNIWQDVIYDILTGDEWDALDTSDSTKLFTHAGSYYRWEPSRHAWVCASPADA